MTFLGEYHKIGSSKQNTQRQQIMATKGQELKKELTQAFSGLKFFVKTKMVCKSSITEIAVTIKGLKDSDYTISEIKEITNKYHNWDWKTVTGDTNVVVNTDEETKEEIDNPVVETIQKTKEETTDTAVKTVKEIKPQNKVSKLQTRLTRLNAQLRITGGRQNQHKLIEKILKIEAAIEQLKPKQKKITLSWEQQKSLNALTGGKCPIFSKLTEKSKEELLKIVNELKDLEREEYRDKCTGKGLWKRPSEASIKRSEKRSNKYRLLRRRVEQLELIQEKSVEIKKEIEQSKPVDVPATKKNEFCKNPEKATIKFLESKFKNAQVDITETQVIIKSGTSELAMNLFFEIPDINDYYNQYRRTKTIKNLKQKQTSKIHSVHEYISAILLAS